MHGDTPTPPMDEERDDDPLTDEEIEIIDLNSEEEELLEQEGDDEYIHDNSTLVFDKHEKAVFCCAVSPQGEQYCITGGEDDVAYVWNRNTGDIHFECTGHKDSVIATCFNHDGSLVATGDMSGVIGVWKVETKERVWDFEISELRWMEWHHRSNVLCAGTGEGEAWMWRIPSGNCKTFQSFGAGNECGKIMQDGTKAIMGYEDGKIRIWDLKSCSVIHAITDNTAHIESVTVIDCYQDGTLAMTGSTDASAKIINTVTGKVITTFHCGEIEAEDSVESVAFCISQPVAATGTVQGSLAVWDIPTQIQREQFQQDSGISKLLWGASSSLLYTAGLDGVVRLYDGRSGSIERSWYGHKDEILDMVVSKVDNYILTTSQDTTCRLFHTE